MLLLLLLHFFVVVVKNHLYIILLGIIILSSCSDDNENLKIRYKEGAPVTIDIDIVQSLYVQPREINSSDEITVNRILIIPFVKTSESLDNSDFNFVPDFNLIKQIDLDSFPYFSSKLTLLSSHTYIVYAIGCNSADFDFNSQDSLQNKFSIGANDTPLTLGNFHIETTNILDVPELFTGIGEGYNISTTTGNYFQPENITNLKIELKRMVGKLTLEITEIPENVISISLLTDKLVKAIRISDGEASLWNDNDIEEMDTAIPSGAKISISKFVLPTYVLHAPAFYLDIITSNYRQTFNVNIPDIEGVSENNRVVFVPNHEVRISGSYDKVNSEFVVNKSINIGEDEWNGIN